MWIDAKHDVSVKMFQFLDGDGDRDTDLTEVQLLEMYRWMIFARLYDERMIRLQRQGRVGTYAPFSGQEAAQIGSAYALEPKDWVFPSYRELPVVWVRGQSPVQSMLYTMGAVQGGYVPEDVNAFPVQIIIAAQTLHAMGSAWASQYLQDGAVSVAYLGDGATSQGDFHEALNFASVHQLPAIFFIQNNGWAISVPRSKQAASRTLAQKALAYDIFGIQVDGNDVLAVYHVMQEALKKARNGEGPVLIEAMTYRYGPHTTSDDPTRYRDQEELQAWLEKDPIARFQKYLMRRGVLDEVQDKLFREEASQSIEEIVKKAESTPKGTLLEAFDAVYKIPPLTLSQQKEEIRKSIVEQAEKKGGMTK